MGKYTNSRKFNFVAWATSIIVIALTVVLLWYTLHGNGS
jgi:Mn2+/Fe2+ NRAMP family transporter